MTDEERKERSTVFAAYSAAKNVMMRSREILAIRAGEIQSLSLLGVPDHDRVEQDYRRAAAQFCLSVDSFYAAQAVMREFAERTKMQPPTDPFAWERP